MGASLARGLLRMAEIPYSLAVRWRNCRYDRGKTVIHQAEVPVVSVGNLTLGGTGKTPLVKWIAHWFQEQGIRVVIVSRGYGSKAGAQNDEALELEQTLPDVPHVQNPDRVVAVRQAIDRFDCQLVLLDDGFQHRRLARDLDIVLLDGLEPFGFEHVFPRGTLREPVAGLRRAALVCLSRADRIKEPERNQLRHQVQEVAPQAAWCELAHVPSGLLNASGETESLSQIAGKRVAAFCGIGSPASFRHTLDASGCEVVAWREFPDHHPFCQKDLASLNAWAEASQADLVLCTHKDLVKMPCQQLGRLPLWAVLVEMKILVGEQRLVEALRNIRTTQS